MAGNMMSGREMPGEIGTGPFSQALNAILGSTPPQPGMVSHDPMDNQPGGMQGMILKVLSMLLGPGGMLAKQPGMVPVGPGGGMSEVSDPIMGVAQALLAGNPNSNLDPARSFRNIEDPRMRMGEMARRNRREVLKDEDAGPGQLPSPSLLDPTGPMRASGPGAPEDMRAVVGQGSGDPMDYADDNAPPSNLDPAQSYKNMYGPKVDNSQTAAETNPIADIIAMLMQGDGGGTPVTPGMVSREFKDNGPTSPDMEAEMDAADELMPMKQAAVPAKVMNVDPGSLEPDHQDEEPTGDFEQKTTGKVTKEVNPIEAFAMGQAKQGAARETTGQIPDGEDAVSSTTGRTGFNDASDRTYTIKEGDSLFKIAKRIYGDGNRWRELAKANKLNVKNPNQIRTGRTLVIPGNVKPRSPTQRPFRGYGGGAHQG